ncbi:MAG: hypothetical protein ACKO2Z_09480 [Sphaerospermopsis kisseleviana]
MNGDSYLLDTNAVVAVLQGNTQLLQILQNADWIGISVISQIEFLAFSGLSELDYQLFQEFIQRVEVVGLSAKDTLLIDNILKFVSNIA